MEGELDMELDLDLDVEDDLLRLLSRRLSMDGDVLRGLRESLLGERLGLGLSAHVLGKQNIKIVSTTDDILRRQTLPWWSSPFSGPDVMGLREGDLLPDSAGILCVFYEDWAAGDEIGSMSRCTGFFQGGVKYVSTYGSSIRS